MGFPRLEQGISYRARPCYDVAAMPPQLLEPRGTVIVAPDASRYLTVEKGPSSSRAQAGALRGLTDQRLIHHFGVPEIVDAGFSPDGRRLALLVDRRRKEPGIVTGGFARGLHVFDTGTGQEVVTIPIPVPVWPEPDWLFSSDGRAVALWYGRGPGQVRDGDDPDDRPKTVAIWEIAPG
jgi:hypothetical protein